MNVCVLDTETEVLAHCDTSSPAWGPLYYAVNLVPCGHDGREVVLSDSVWEGSETWQDNNRDFWTPLGDSETHGIALLKSDCKWHSSLSCDPHLNSHACKDWLHLAFSMSPGFEFFIGSILLQWFVLQTHQYCRTEMCAVGTLPCL